MSIFDSEPTHLMSERTFDFRCLRGEISGTPAIVLANQGTSTEGTPMTRIDAISAILNTAATERIPVIWVIRGIPKGASQELAFPPNYPEFFLGTNGSGAYLGSIFRHRLFAPQIAIVDQEITSSRALALTGCDLVLMHQDSAMTIGRPTAVHSFARDIGDGSAIVGTDIHKTQTGLCAFEWSDFSSVAEFLSSLFLIQKSARVDDIALNIEIPSRADVSFDIRNLSDRIFDCAEKKITLWKDFAPEILCEIGQINGQQCGVMANNCLSAGGFITIAAIKKMSRFIRLLERLKLPSISLVDCAGLYSDPKSEAKGIFESAGDLLMLLAQRQQPHICIVVRRAYSAGLYLMGGGNYTNAQNYALPTARFSIYGPKILNKEICSESDKSTAFSEMLDLHDHPEHMSVIGGYRMLVMKNLKKSLVFED